MPSVFSWGGSLLPSRYADACYIDDVIVSKATGWADTHKQVVAATLPGNGDDAAVSGGANMSGTGSKNGHGNLGGDPTITVVTSPLSSEEGRARAGGWLRVYNSISDLDAPGEYVIVANSTASKLLLLVYPPSTGFTPTTPTTPTAPTIVLSLNSGPLVRRDCTTTLLRYYATACTHFVSQPHRVC